MDLLSLATFANVARQGGVTGASRQMHTVQSNVTQRIRALEKELGLELFHRHSRGMALTRAGQRMLPYVDRIAALVAEAKAAATGSDAAAASIAIGSMETTAAMRLPAVLAAFRREQPGVTVSLETGPTATLIDAVLQRRIDGAFVAGPVDCDELVTRVAFREELVLVSPAHLKRADDVGKHLLEGGAAIMFRVGCSYRQRFEQLLSERGWPNYTRLEMGTLEGILGCIGAGMGISLLPKAILQSGFNMNSVKCHALKGVKYSVDTLFVRRRDERPSGALTRFTSLL